MKNKQMRWYQIGSTAGRQKDEPAGGRPPVDVKARALLFNLPSDAQYIRVNDEAKPGWKNTVGDFYPDPK